MANHARIEKFKFNDEKSLVGKNMVKKNLAYVLIMASSLVLYGLGLEPVLAQRPEPNKPTPRPVPVPTQVDDLNNNENELKPAPPTNILLSVKSAERLMNEASVAIESQNYDLAIKKLQEVRQIYNQLSNLHQQLSASFSGIDNQIAEDQRQKAADTAEKRDESTYQLALIHRAQNQPDLAIPLLVQVIRSQQPRAGLGKKAQEQLMELGLIEAPTAENTEPVPPPATNILLSVKSAESLMNETSVAIQNQNYDLAIKKLQEVRQIYNQLSNLHQQLSASFSGIDNQIAEDQRRKAADTAEKRDESTYQLALIHRAQNQPDLAIPLLVQVIRSQQPRAGSGKKAHEQLMELGVIEIPTAGNTERVSPNR